MVITKANSRIKGVNIDGVKKKIKKNKIINTKTRNFKLYTPNEPAKNPKIKVLL